jgi:hypothetical protein
MLTRVLERPGVLLAILLVGGLGIGASMVHLATPAPQPRAFERPPAHLQCGHAVSEWLEGRGD